MEKMEEEISEIKSDVKVIRQNIDTLLSFSTDHEARLRVQEQSQCPFHEKVEDRLDKQDVNNAITTTKLAIIGTACSFGGAFVAIFFKVVAGFFLL
jgi:hypothetical protein